MTDKPSPSPKPDTLRMPLKNFKHLGPLSPEQEEWWQSFGQFMANAGRDFDAVQRERDACREANALFRRLLDGEEA